jgi:bifunctional DNA-binding transcriptional regulator/antitoxin component of YhaV-PrlF toxin-antitoxin module
MKYETTITSKGTITIASPLRKALNLKPGRKVRLFINTENKLQIDPGMTLEDFESARERLVSSIPEDKLALKGGELEKAIEKAKIADCRKKYQK